VRARGVVVVDRAPPPSEEVRLALVADAEEQQAARSVTDDYHELARRAPLDGTNIIVERSAQFVKVDQRTPTSESIATLSKFRSSQNFHSGVSQRLFAMKCPLRQIPLTACLAF
jgi:hypothetical protein